MSRGISNFQRPRTNSPFPHIREKKTIKKNFISGGLIFKDASFKYKNDQDFTAKENSFNRNITINENLQE